MQHLRLFTAPVAWAMVAAMLLCGCDWLVPPPDANAISVAQDRVYEAVVREMVTPADERSGVSELVFSNRVSTPIMSSHGLNSCKEQARLDLDLTYSPPYNTIADKVYRLVTRGDDDYVIRADTIRDFLHAYCTAGRLSESFQTGLPRHFIDPDARIYKTGWKSFRRLFPGATGIISFSRVGFDRKLDQAIVFTSAICAGLCGGGTIYVLRKVHGQWNIVSTRLVWES